MSSLSLGLVVPGCQDGYPIAATPCDRYCDLGLSPGCHDVENPAGCVVACETFWGATAVACRAEFDALVACLKAHEYPLVCDYTQPAITVGCESMISTLSVCQKAHPHRAPIDGT